MIPGSEAAIETLGLRKAFRSVRGRAVGVDGLDLRVPAGGVHALLGLPGSGRTTTLRLLTGLAHADSGAIKIFGVPVPDGLPELAGRIGAVVGEPGFQGRLSGRRNLSLLASAAGVPRTRVDEVLARVVLADRARAAYGTYSPDEGRRLALAAALLGEPDLLVVDEPSAGLDAVGTREIRQALRRLADQGMTVLVATGVLTEAQQIADTVTVLDGGRVLAQGAVADLLGDARVSVRVRLDEPAKATTALRAAGFKVRADGDVLHVDDVAEPSDISRALAKQKLFAAELVPQREDLVAVVGRLRPVVPPAPKVPSRAEERAARKVAEQQAAERTKAAEQRKAAKAAAAEQARADAEAADEAAARQAAIDARTAAKEAAVAERAAAKEAADAERAAAKDARRAGRKPPGSGAAAAAPADGSAAERTAGPTAEGSPGSDAAAPQSKRALRQAAFEAKVAEKQAAAESRLAERQAAAAAKEAAKQAAVDDRVAQRQARAAQRQGAIDEKAAAKQAAIDEKAAAKQARIDDRAARKQAVVDDKAVGKQHPPESGEAPEILEPGVPKPGAATSATGASGEPGAAKSGAAAPGPQKPGGPKPGPRQDRSSQKSDAAKPDAAKPGAPKPGAQKDRQQDRGPARQGSTHGQGKNRGDGNR